MTRKSRLLTCPCGGIFFTLHGVSLNRHPRRFVYSRMRSHKDYVTCESCGENFCATSYLGLDASLRQNPWKRTLTVNGEIPRWAQRQRRKLQEQPVRRS